MKFTVTEVKFNGKEGLSVEVGTGYNGNCSVEGCISLSYHNWGESKEWSFEPQSIWESNEYVSRGMLAELDSLLEYFNDNVVVDFDNQTLKVNKPMALHVDSEFEV